MTPSSRLSRTSYMLFITSIFICCGVLYRYHNTTSLRYFFLIWNLFLAWIPFGASVIVKLSSSKIKQGLAFFSWALFFPNAPYIITDLFHLTLKDRTPLWYDTLLIFSFALIGLLLGIFSMYLIQSGLQKVIGKIMSHLFILGYSFLAAFGIYIGRYHRWNSWDIISQPTELFQDILHLSLHPNGDLLSFCFTFGGFIYVIYYLSVNAMANLNPITLSQKI